MARSTKRKDDLIEDLDLLLGELCTQSGFCNGLTAAQLFCATSQISAADFSRAILEAEGMDPDNHLEHQRSIRTRFRGRYGEYVDEATYRPAETVGSK